MTRTRVGYAGGHLENPTYEDVCSHRTGHAEVVEVTFDDGPGLVRRAARRLLAQAQPDAPNRQGWDIGDQYRSVIFVHDEEQRAAAEASKASEQASYRKAIVTQIEPAPTFYEAEDYHQQYLEKRGRSTCTPALRQTA